MTKQCIGCMEHKQDDEFYPSRNSEDGLNRYCKQCCKVNRSLESVRKRDKSSKISYRQCHRAKQLGTECDTAITLAGVFKADRGICGICGLWVQPRHSSMDHIHPLAKGGTHTWHNIQLTHLKCNLKKSSKYPYSM